MAEFVSVDTPGNRPDRFEHGCVPYRFEIAKCAVSNQEWCDFLNAVGREEAMRRGFYHKDMSSGVLGGITADGGTFAPKPGWGKKPVVYVNYVSLLCYCNWLSSGDIEHGAYDLAKTPPERICGAKYFLPNDDEWYKAAYWRNGRYVDYPTGDEMPRQDEANYEKGDDLAVGPPFYFADVDGFQSSPAPCGALQMGGNAWEILENVSRDAKGRLQCHYRGGSFGYTETGLSRRNCDSAPYNGRCYVFGARIARIKDGWRPECRPWKYEVMRRAIKWARCLKRFVRG